MKTSVEDISPVKKRLTVEIEADEVGRKMERAYRTWGKTAKIPGFRPGKIPRKIIERRFGKEVVDEVTRELVNETLPQAVEDTETFPLTIPAVENDTLKAGQSFRYTCLLYTSPSPRD